MVHWRMRMTKKEVKKEDKEKPDKTYSAKVGCWNCDTIYKIAIKMGEMTPQYLHDNKVYCKTCGCDTLKMFSEYLIEKKIMKDIILHHRIEHMSDDDEKPKNNDYIK